MKNQLEHIAEKVLLHCDECNDNGLWFGKMGIAIFLFHYAKQTKDKRFEEKADELIDSLYTRIDTLDKGISSGIAGIGVGIEYLVQNGFFEGDTDDILEDFDTILRGIVVCETHNVKSILNSAKYFKYRITNQTNKNKTQSFHIKFSIIQVIDILYEFFHSGIFPKSIDGIMCSEYVDYILDFINETYELYPVKASKIIDHILALPDIKKSISLYTAVKLLKSNKILRYSNRLYDICMDLHNNKFMTVKYFDDLKSYIIQQIYLKNNENIPNNDLYQLNNVSHLGLKGGYAGLGMLMLTTLEPSIYTWFDLIDL